MESRWDKSLNKWIRHLGPYGITEKDFVQRREEFSKNPQVWTDRDVIWSLFDDAMKRMDASRQGGLLYLMSLFQNEEGSDALAVRRDSAESGLAQYRRMRVTEVEVLAAPDSCEACKRLGGRRFTVEQVLAEHPLPCLECTHKLRKKDAKPFCRCIYLPVINTGVKG